MTQACQVRGSIAIVPPLACDSNPCVNGGTCAGAGPEYGQTFTCRCTSGYAGESCEQQEAKNDFWMSVVECAAEIAEAAAVDGAAAAFAGQHVLPTSGH